MNKLLQVVIFLLISTAAFAEDDIAPLTVYAWGYGDLLHMTFQAIMRMVGNNGYAAFFKITATIGILGFLIYAVSSREISLYSLVMRFAFSFIVWSFVSVGSGFSVSTDVQVYDVYTNRYSKIIEDVPLGFAGPIGFFSRVEYWLNNNAQDSFSVTDAGIAASGAGYVPPSIGSGLIYSASQFRVTDPNLYMTMNDYISDCVFPDIITGYFDPNDLRVSNTFWQSIADTHP
ncbi:MAG: conjugal transfer protein TraG N-terminal domain-containing protein, partial [Deferribacteraceae bacterium]|nr:conjugal transfer protein TraG N-terminal domain-containing protein [Deferribacteraceae bacterium]